MTIKKLKEMIADLPDNMRVYADDAKYLGDDVTEFCHVFVSKREPRKAILQTAHDIDAFKETQEDRKKEEENEEKERIALKGLASKLDKFYSVFDPYTYADYEGSFEKTLKILKEDPLAVVSDLLQIAEDYTA